MIIATLDRLASLRLVLACLDRQTCRPREIIIAAAGDAGPVQALAREFEPSLPVRVLPWAEKSSARQRNAAAAIARGEILAFLDDDIEFAPDLFARLLGYFSRSVPTPGAIAARIPGEDHPAPGRLARAYYCLQAGYRHPDFGGRLFGPGINSTPVYRPDSPELFPADWLPATCLFVRADLFHRERFPAFTGYSFAEDVHLTARIARHAPLFFASHCAIEHHSLPSEFKRDVAALTAGKLRNMAVIAREILGLRGAELFGHLLLHRLFLTVATLRTRPPRWPAVLRGLWTFSA